MLTLEVLKDMIQEIGIPKLVIGLVAFILVLMFAKELGFNLGLWLVRLGIV